MTANPNATAPQLTRTEEDDAVTPTLTVSPLTAADRCDRCGAQAYVRVVMLSGGELLFCAHHARQYEPALMSVAATVQDESERLAEVPPTAAMDER